MPTLARPCPATLLPHLAAPSSPCRHEPGLENALNLSYRDPDGPAKPDVPQPALGNPSSNRCLRQIQFGGGLLDSPRLAFSSHSHSSPRMHVHLFSD